MRRSRVVIALLAVAIAIVIQTTLFGAGRIQPFGVAPALVTLVVIGTAPYLEPEYNVLLGFTSGILLDLIGSGTLGLWAMTLTVVAFVASALRTRYTGRVLMSLVVAFSLTLVGQLVYVFLGTLFGQETAAEPGLAAKIILPAVWNLILAYPVFWVFRLVFQPRDRSWAA
jgi:rod shape-determining protein MreD